MSAVAQILKPGLSTTIQDMGRTGFRHLGVPLSGAADRISLGLANAALGNPLTAAGLECTLNGPALTFLHETAIALGGADMNAQLNGASIDQYRMIKITAGDSLVLGPARAGARAYIAFAGGLAGDMFLESVSTYAPAGIGGHQGRALNQGDILAGANLAISPSRDIPQALRPRLSGEFIFRALAGPESETIGTQGLDIFFSTRWTIGRRADRMGVLLEGGRIAHPPSPPLVSSPVFPGAVQCPPDGAPFLLLCDGQTVGGYSRIAQMIAADLPLSGQLRPGDHVWFRKTTAEDARDIGAKKSALFREFLSQGFFN